MSKTPDPRASRFRQAAKDKERGNIAVEKEGIRDEVSVLREVEKGFRFWAGKGGRGKIARERHAEAKKRVQERV